MVEKQNKTQSKKEKKEVILEPKEVVRRVTESLKQYDDATFLETFGVFMGKAQIVELALKSVLVNSHKYEEEKIEKHTLGRTIKELEKCDVRPDFIILLSGLLEHRNLMAHEFLAVNAMGKKLAGDAFEILNTKQLKYALFKVEEVIQVYDFLIENDYLYKGSPEPEEN